MAQWPARQILGLLAYVIAAPRHRNRGTSGHMMRFLRPDEAWDGLDTKTFSWAEPAEARRGH